MAVRRKPISKPTSVDDFILDAASSDHSQDAEDQIKSLKLRIPAQLLEQIDNSVKSRRPSPSRHQWILEALYQKLDSEQQEGAGNGLGDHSSVTPLLHMCLP